MNRKDVKNVLTQNESVSHLKFFPLKFITCNVLQPNDRYIVKEGFPERTILTELPK